MWVMDARAVLPYERVAISLEDDTLVRLLGRNVIYS